MSRSAKIAVGIVAGLHVGFALAEMLAWETLIPLLKIYDPDLARATSTVGRNMGLYNGIMAAILFWILSATRMNASDLRSLTSLVLICVVIAGIFGGISIKWTIPIFQSVPALVALVLVRRGGPI
jgi:putative membrane protein